MLRAGTHADDFDHFLRLDGSISIHVVHLEGPRQLLFGLACGGDVDGEHKFSKVDHAAVVFVEGPEDVAAEPVGVTTREERGVNFQKLVPCELPCGTVPLLGEGVGSLNHTEASSAMFIWTSLQRR